MRLQCRLLSENQCRARRSNSSQCHGARFVLTQSTRDDNHRELQNDSSNKCFRVMLAHFLKSTVMTFGFTLVPRFLAAATLMWSPNGERDLAGYKVYIGEKSKQYGTVISVGKRTQYNLDHLSRNKTYYLAVTAYDVSGNESPLSVEIVLPATNGGDNSSNNETTLERTYNFPNPFRAGSETTTIRYFLAEAARVSIRVFDVKGDLIKTLSDKAQRSAGENLGDTWDGTDANGVVVSPGLYFVEVQAQERKTIVKLAVHP